MFILVAPLLEIDQINLAEAPSQESTSHIEDKSPVTIHVRSDNTILINQRTVTTKQLQEVLNTAHRQFPNANPQLFHDSTAPFGTYQSIKNAVETAGFEQLDVILKPV
jgi:biopolymer transport protein ExbD